MEAIDHLRVLVAEEPYCCSCAFCGNSDPEHEPDCPWLAAKAFVESYVEPIVIAPPGAATFNFSPSLRADRTPTMEPLTRTCGYGTCCEALPAAQRYCPAHLPIVESYRKKATQ